MTDLSSTAPEAAPSTQLEPSQGTANPTSFKPAADVKPEPPKPLTARQALEKAAAEAKGDNTKTPEAKAVEPAKSEVKPELKPEQPRDNGKFASPNPETPKTSTVEAKGTGQEGEIAARPSEGREHDTPPARFLPRAKEQWANVPDDVKGEVHRALQNAEKGMEEYRESHEFRKELRQYEEMAKNSNTSIARVLDEYVQVYNQLRQDPAVAIQRLLASVGITPQQYVQHVMGQEAQPKQQANPEIQQMRQQMQQMESMLRQMTQGNEQDRERARLSELERTIIGPFRDSHPRYVELETDIAFFLNSDRIPSTLNEHQRLEAAYDMAERINPAPHLNPPGRITSATPERPINPAGEKSIKGTPTPGTNLAGDKGNLSPRDAIRAAAAEHGIQM